MEMVNLAKTFTKKREILIQKAIPEIVFWMFFFTSIMLKCFYFQFTTQLNLRPFFSSVNIGMLVSNLGMIIILFSLVTFVFHKNRIRTLFVLDLIITIILLADTNFFRYYYNAITIPVFFQFNVGLIGSVNKSIFSLFKPKDIIYLLDFPIILIGLIYFKRNQSFSLKASKRLALFAILLLCGLLINFSAYYKSNIELFIKDNNYIAKSLGVLYFHVYDAKEFIDEKFFESKDLNKSDKNMLNTYFSGKTQPRQKLSGVAKDKNLIIVQIEAMQQFLINRKVNGNEVTPNLNKLIKESLYFDNFYFQVAGGNTSDAEFLCNTSLYPTREGAIYHRYPENKYYTLPKTLAAKGYNSYVFHAYKPEFYNRINMYNSIGFQKFISEEDFILDDKIGWDGTSLSDISFFKQSLDKIDTSTPFYSFFITLSSHHPFDYFEDFDFPVGNFEGLYIGNYIKAANYADKALGLFIEDLKRRNLFDNSLLVMYGDHSAVPKHQAAELFTLLEKPYSEPSWTALQKVPLIVHYPGIKNGEIISTTGGEIDIFPTVANLMGFDAPFALGKDLVNATKGYAVLRSGSVVTDKYVYLNNLREIYDIKTGAILKNSTYKNELKTLLQDLKVSDTIIEKDAFSKFTPKQ